MKLWGGRFKGEPDSDFARFNASFSFDRRLIEADIEASVAHAEALASAGILMVALTLGTFDGPMPLHFGEQLSQAQIAALYVLAALVSSGAAALAGRNSEYSAKRKSGRYGPPVLRVVRSGEFDRYRRRMVEGGRSDGQFKILRLTGDPAFAGEFESERDLMGAGQP